MIRNKGKQEEKRIKLKNDTEKGQQARGEQKNNECRQANDNRTEQDNNNSYVTSIQSDGR